MNIDVVYQKFNQIVVYALLLVMGVIVAASVIELIYLLIIDLMEPPGLMLNLSELYELFGLFLMVVIALELMNSIYVYIKDQSAHLEIMFLIAITAVTRKILVVDTQTMDSMYLIGVALLVGALSWGYVHVKQSRISEQDSQK